MHPRLLLEQLSAQELVELEAFIAMEGLPSERADLNAAKICAVIVNHIVAAVSGKDAKATPEDFMPDFDGSRQPKEMREEDMKAIFEQFCKHARKDRGENKAT